MLVIFVLGFGMVILGVFFFIIVVIIFFEICLVLFLKCFFFCRGDELVLVGLFVNSWILLNLKRGVFGVDKVVVVDVIIIIFLYVVIFMVKD